MVKKSLEIIIAIFTLSILAINAISFVNAEVLISQPKTAYNLGDIISLDITLDSLKAGYLDINLICSNYTKNLYHNVPDSTLITLSRELTPAYIDGLYGTCYLKTNYNIDESISQSFLISKEISIDTEITNATYMAGSSLTIKGTAIKKNNLLVGQDYTSFVEASIIRFNETISAKDTVRDGQFSVNFTIPENTRAGVYSLQIHIFDIDNEGGTLNEGALEQQLNIAQKSARMEVAFDKTSVVPGEEIAFVPTLFDMANDEIKDKILVKITSVDQRTYFEGYVESGLNHTIKTEKDYLPGYASIKLQSEEIIVKKSFEIKELKKINTEIINKTLVITNVGNVPYNGLIEVSIGNSTLLEEVNLALGERKEFYLSAPEGVYEISVKDDNDIFQHSGISLTGSAINVNEVGKKIFSSYPIAWTFIILVLILFSYIFVKKYLRNKRMHFNEFKKEQISGNEYFKKKDSIKVITPEKTKKDVEEIILSNNEIRKARYELVMQGKKQEAGLISLKIKSSLSGIEKDTFNQAMEYAYKAKGAVYQSGDYFVVVFSPLITGKAKNEHIAVKIAQDIDNLLREHNRKFRNNIINYGIGVNVGNIVNSIDEGILRFASIDKTVNITRKISDISNNEVLLSKEVHEKTISNVKAEKVGEPSAETRGLTLFRIKRIVDHEASKKFIDEFMRRQ